jgi:glycosyltransferase involved in cell wall biosynthesis
VRRFLYITPYFPPQSRVGALRPLKFARHLPSHGWTPVILCDLKPSDRVDPDLLKAVPETTVVFRTYGAFAWLSERVFLRRKLRATRHDAIGTAGSEGRPGRAAGRRRIRLPSLPTPPPEHFPLGWHRLDMIRAVPQARRILGRFPCEAVMVNADPYDALVVGRKVARESDLPLILDLRDPWSVCALRRPLRPPRQLRTVDRIEREAVMSAFRVILNTETALEAYRRHYRDLPAERFTCIRSHGDRELVSHGAFSRSPEFTVLYMGRFRRFVEGDPMIRMLAELKRRGHGPADIRLVVSGAVPADSLCLAERLGVDDILDRRPAVPYRQIGPFMASADLLISLSPATDQRIAAKFFDYALSPRPILLITENREFEDLANRLGGVTVRPLHDVGALADVVEEEMRLGKGRTVTRAGDGLDSATASARLAEILDAAAGERTHVRHP